MRRNLSTKRGGSCDGAYRCPFADWPGPRGLSNEFGPTSTGHFDFQIAGGTEMQVLSALDLAFWDLLGKSLNAPVYRLLGSNANPQIRLYNTCFPISTISIASRRRSCAS